MCAHVPRTRVLHKRMACQMGLALSWRRFECGWWFRQRAMHGQGLGIHCVRRELVRRPSGRMGT
eukprot:12300521-Alexandrium_andersonii.AAC.1